MWEENWQTIEVFLALTTQWRMIVGMTATAQGLDYAAVPPVMDLMGIKKRRRKEIFAGLRVMERAALDTWYGDDK